MTKEQFLEGVTNWSNHRYLLWEALSLTSGIVVEMGIGDGSTPFLHQYCKDENRWLYSYDNNREWTDKFNYLNNAFHRVMFIDNWDFVFNEHIHPSVLFIDHAPGERRKIDLEKFAPCAAIIVCHDTEPAADHGYQMRAILERFKYRKEYKSEGAWASSVSNFVDVSDI